jgi:imidazolonepropionase
MLRLGITTVECKSGYGLDRDTELRLLRVYRRLAASQPTRLVSTFLGAHVVPAEYRERRTDYVRLLIDELIPAVSQEGLARCCDVFVERSAFSIEEARAILNAGRRAGLHSKLHADQLSDGGGALLVAELGAFSGSPGAHFRGGNRSHGRGRRGRREPSARDHVPEPAANAGPATHRRGGRRGGRHRLQSGFCTELPPALRIDLGVHVAADDTRQALKGATIYAARAVGRGIGCRLAGGRKYATSASDVPDATQALSPSGNACANVIGGETVWRS